MMGDQVFSCFLKTAENQAGGIFLSAAKVQFQTDDVSHTAVETTSRADVTALKRITCHSKDDQSIALREIENCQRIDSEHVIIVHSSTHAHFTSIHQIGMGEKREVPENLSQEGHDFIDHCLQHDTKDRMTALELLEHHFLYVLSFYFEGSQSMNL
uniref:Protein kinase domain-containing protein n=1 Tax=Glossina pallidipes TaxID=7398 RepID=A0A1B0AH94_GLOPL